MFKWLKKFSFKKNSKLFCEILRITPTRVILTIFLTAIIGFIPYIEVKILGYIGDSVVTGDLIILLNWIVLLVLCKLLVILLNFTVSTLKNKILLDISLAFEIKLIRKTLRIELREKEKEEYGNIASRAFGAINPNQLISLVTSFPNIISCIITCISLTILLLSIHFFIPIGIFVVFISTINMRLKSISQYYTSQREQTSELRLTNTLAGYLLNINTLTELKTYKAHVWMLEKWKLSYRTWQNKHIHMVLKNSINMQFVNVIMDRLILPLISLFLLLTKVTGIYSIIICIQATEQLASNLNLIANDIAFFSTSEEISSDYYSMLNYKENNHKKEETIYSPIGIRCNNISYSYDDKEYALNNINVDIKPGEKIALVGLNGSGKTTLSKLLLNIYNKQNGEIYYYTDERALEPTEISRRSALFQNYCIYYNLSIQENILLGDINNLNIDDANRILKSIGFDDRQINETIIGNAFGGIELSGGQSQKIALGRCLHKSRCGLVCLDEPLASLDPLFETKLLRLFFSSIGDTTCIFVTHRLSSALLSDRVIMLEGGKIIEDGKHAELMSKKGKYYELFNAQAEMYR
ncbi:MAG: ABC transporter ATP-binding protein [Clostridia bacterium]|nr:ABC transporter ATP-binding protein [Clostridia bacterium]